MKIGVCMIVAYFPPVVGGAEIQTFRLARALINKNVAPLVITRRLKGVKRFEMMCGVPVHRLFTFGSGIFASLSFMLSSLSFLVKNRKKYHIIHAHLASSPAITATITGKVLRKKIIVKFGGAGKTGDLQVSHRTFSGRAKLKFLMKGADCFICPSAEVERELINYGFPKRKVVKVPNGVDTSHFHPVDEVQKEDLKRQFNLPPLPIVVYSGRLESGKGLAELFKAWQFVARVGQGSFLLVLGDGSEKNNLINLAKELKITDSIRFTGHVDNVNEYLQISNGFVFPSNAEGLSNALLEAMATELPIVATRIGGTEEAIEDKKNGVLIEPGNVDELAKGITALLSQPELAHRLGEEARRTIEENYSIGIIGEKYLKVYEEMVK